MTTLSGSETVLWSDSTTVTLTDDTTTYSDVIDMRGKGGFFVIIKAVPGTGHDAVDGTAQFEVCWDQAGTRMNLNDPSGYGLDAGTISTHGTNTEYTQYLPAVTNNVLAGFGWATAINWMQISVTNGDADKDLTIQIELYYEAI
jgi:hypothetical protein